MIYLARDYNIPKVTYQKSRTNDEKIKFKYLSCVPFLGSRVAITGTLVNYTRKEIIKKLRSLGATVVDTVTDTTDYLIASITTGRKKLDAATKYGTQIISEQEFENMVS